MKKVVIGILVLMTSALSQAVVPGATREAGDSAALETVQEPAQDAKVTIWWDQFTNQFVTVLVEKDELRAITPMTEAQREGVEAQLASILNWEYCRQLGARDWDHCLQLQRPRIGVPPVRRASLPAWNECLARGLPPSACVKIINPIVLAGVIDWRECQRLGLPPSACPKINQPAAQDDGFVQTVSDTAYAKPIPPAPPAIQGPGLGSQAQLGLPGSLLSLHSRLR